MAVVLGRLRQRKSSLVLRIGLRCSRPRFFRLKAKLPGRYSSSLRARRRIPVSPGSMTSASRTKRPR